MRMTQYRVLAVLDGFRLTGPARQLLASRRCPNALITLAIFQRSPERTPLINATRALDVPMHVLPDRFPGDPRTARALARLAASPANDMLQTHGYKANILAALIRGRIHRPWIAFVHGETWENWKVRLYFALERAAIRRADRIVVVSKEMARALAVRGIPSSKLRVVHNACLIENLDSEPPAWNELVPPVIGVVGRLSPEKGVDIALAVHRAVTERCQGARLLVIGEGPQEAALVRLGERLGIGSSVEWLGYRDDMGELYRRMAVLLMPSRSEGLPNVALEAMAHGVPVVATAVGGVPEVVRSGETGFLMPPGDTEGLAARVVQLLEDAALRRRLGEAACVDVRSRFSIQARCQALADLYKEAAQGDALRVGRRALHSPAGSIRVSHD